MAKISQASSKYIVHAKIEIDGVVDKPDVVGAIFGQIEGLLGADLELRELQRSGRIGRIEVDVKSVSGKTTGTITIPSSLDKAETAIIGGALEIIERIGPCAASLQVLRIEDERAAKRAQVIARAKELLKNLNSDELPDSTDLSNSVSTGARTADITTYGKEKLACGPDVQKSDDIIPVEGRADVLTLLRHGFQNAISVNGTSTPESIKKLSKKKTVTILCDGDRGGDLIIKELTSTCDINFVTKAPDGKEVEELQAKEIHQALRQRLSPKDWEKKHSGRGRRNDSRGAEKTGRGRRGDSRNDSRKDTKTDSRRSNDRRGNNRRGDNEKAQRPTPKALTEEQKNTYWEYAKQLRKKDAAFVLDGDDQVLGKLDKADLGPTLAALDKAKIVVFNGPVDKDLGRVLDGARLKLVIAREFEGKLRTRTLLRDELKK